MKPHVVKPQVMKPQVVRARNLRRLAGRGYNLVALTVIVAVLLIVLGAAVPSFEQQLRREREEEAIFRGLQIAEAIRVFQLRQGRLPVTLEELLEVEPRAIRQLWKDPLVADGVWGLVRGAGPTTPGTEPPEAGEEVPEAEDGDEDDGEDEEGAGPGPSFALDQTTGEAAASIGPIFGVFSRASDAATILFLGEEVYKEWRFTPELLPKPIVGAAGDLVTRANASTVGRSFLYGLAPAGLSALEDEELTPSGGATDVFADEEEEEGAEEDDE